MGVSFFAVSSSAARGNAGLDRLREPNLVVLGQEVVATDVFEVQAYEVFVVAVFTAGLHVLGGHFAAFRCRCRAGSCSGRRALKSLIGRIESQIETSVRTSDGDPVFPERQSS